MSLEYLFDNNQIIAGKQRYDKIISDLKPLVADGYKIWVTGHRYVLLLCTIWSICFSLWNLEYHNLRKNCWINNTWSYIYIRLMFIYLSVLELHSVPWRRSNLLPLKRNGCPSQSLVSVLLPLSLVPQVTGQLMR